MNTNKKNVPAQPKKEKSKVIDKRKPELLTKNDPSGVRRLDDTGFVRFRPPYFKEQITFNLNAIAQQQQPLTESIKQDGTGVHLRNGFIDDESCGLITATYQIKRLHDQIKKLHAAFKLKVALLDDATQQYNQVVDECDNLRGIITNGKAENERQHEEILVKAEMIENLELQLKMCHDENKRTEKKLQEMIVSKELQEENKTIKDALEQVTKSAQVQIKKLQSKLAIIAETVQL